MFCSKKMINYKIFQNVYIGSDGFLFDENGEIIKTHSNHDFIYEKKDKNFKNYPIIELEGKYVDLTHYYNFWPFAHRYDCFSRLRHIENENILTNDIKFLVGINNNSNRLDIERQIFNVKNITYHPDSNTLLKIKFLIYPFWLYGEQPCHFTNESFIYCKQKYTNYYVDDNNNYKIFLTRINIHRNIINFNQVHEFFKNNGFVIIYGDEDIKTTINYFYNSKIIVGIHGGLFSNMIFCGNKLNKVIEIFPKERYNGCFVGWNDQLNINYKTLIFESKENNIHLDTDNLNEIINLI